MNWKRLWKKSHRKQQKEKNIRKRLRDMVSQIVLMVKNLPPKSGGIRDTDSIPGLEDSLEESMATHPSILQNLQGQNLQNSACRIPGTEEPGGLVQWVANSQM